jgi:hypothetical protein
VPVGRTSTRREVTAVALALGGVLVAVLLGVAMLHLARGGDVKVHLGSDVFNAGKVSRIAPAIANEGPALYSDVAGGSRDLILNHLGTDPNAGWVAFSAREPGAARSCYVSWQADRKLFVDTCSGDTYPPDGTGLEQFPVSVQGGDVIVDVNRTAERNAEREDSTTSSVVQSGIPRTTTTG